MLKNVNSGLYMDVCGAKAVNGTNVIQYSASKAKANNTWKFVPDGKGYYYIYSCLGDGRTFLQTGQTSGFIKIPTAVPSFTSL